MLLDNIKELCEKHNVTIASLEKATGIGNGVIAKWANSSPRVNSLEKIAAFFCCTIDDLIKQREE